MQVDFLKYFRLVHPRDQKVVICGGPRTGKSTMGKDLSERLKLDYREGDELYRAGVDWSESSLEICFWMDDPGPWVIEGVQVPRALRKWMNRHSEGKPCEVAIWLGERQDTWEQRHEPMEKGCKKVWAEVAPMLRARGVKVGTL